MLRAVDASDGVSETEAKDIAWSFFIVYFGMCGGPDDPTLVDGSWHFRMHHGIGGTLYPRELEIQADDGGVRVPGEVEFETLEDFRRSYAERIGMEPVD